MLAFARRQSFGELLSIILVAGLLNGHSSQDVLDAARDRLGVLLHWGKLVLLVAEIDTVEIFTELSDFLLQVTLFVCFVDR